MGPIKQIEGVGSVHKFYLNFIFKNNTNINATMLINIKILLLHD